jgi:surface antigen
MRSALVAIVALAAMLVGSTVTPAMAQPYDDDPPYDDSPYDDGPYDDGPYDDGPYGDEPDDDGYGPPPDDYDRGYDGPPPGYRYRGCSRDRAIGRIIGGIIGGIIGNNLGRGRGRAPATIAGIIFGGIAGDAIARNACRDREADAYYYNQAYFDAFEHPRYGQRYNWRNPYSGHYGFVTPLRDYGEGHRYGYRGAECREFQQAIWIDGHRTQAYGTACRARDGSWRIVRY